MDVRFTTPPERTGLFGVTPQHETFGIADARLVVAGHPERSLIYQRVVKLGPGRMPPLASSVVDVRGAALLRRWIGQLDAKNAGRTNGGP
jgi:hypothetical protein